MNKKLGELDKKLNIVELEDLLKKNCKDIAERLVEDKNEKINLLKSKSHRNELIERLEAYLESMHKTLYLSSYTISRLKTRNKINIVAYTQTKGLQRIPIRFSVDIDKENENFCMWEQLEKTVHEKIKRKIRRKK